MNTRITEIIDLSKFTSFREELITIINYCWNIEHKLGLEDAANYEHFNSGTNEFEQLRKLVDSSNVALMSINSLIDIYLAEKD